MCRVLLILIAIAVHGFEVAALAQTKDIRSAPNVIQLLSQVQAQREVALRDLDRLPSLSADAARDATSALAKFWKTPEVQKEFDDHNSSVAKLLDRVVIRSHRTNLGVYWAAYKAVLRDAELREICKEFSEDAMKELKVEQDRFTNRLGGNFEQAVDSALDKAREGIRVKIDNTIAASFPSLSGLHFPLPKPKIVGQKDGPEPGGSSPLRGALPIAGVLLIVFRKALQRIVSSIALKIAGKVLAKLIPIVGVILLALEVWDAATAKANLQNQLRTTFASEYKSELTSQVVWQELEKETQKQIEDELNRWMKQCKEDARKLLNAAEMLESPGIRAWLDEKIQKGVGENIVVQQLVDIRDTFGQKLVLKHDINLLINIKAFAPDRQDLCDLSRQLGDRVVEECRDGDVTFLQAAHKLGMKTFLDVIKEPTLEWRDVHKTFESLPDNLPDDEKKGVLLALLAEIDAGRLTSSDRKTLGRTDRATVDLLSKACSDKAKLRSLLLDRHSSDTASDICQADLELGRAWFTHRTQDDLPTVEDVSGMLALYKARKDHYGFSTSQFVQLVTEHEIRDFKKFGRDGLDIRDAYIKKSTGEHQQQQARRALTLLETGVEKDILIRPELLGLSEKASIVPCGSLAMKICYPFLPASVTLVWIVAVSIPVILFTCVALILRNLFRKFLRAPVPAAVGPVQKPVEPIQIQILTPHETPSPSLATSNPIPKPRLDHNGDA